MQEKQRIIMNSRNLQEKFPEVYKDFFSDSSIVVSASGSFFWSGEYAAMYGGLALVQKIPLRVYIGITPISGRKIKGGKKLLFVPSKNKFEDFEKVFGYLTAHLKLFDFLNQQLLELYGKQDVSGFRLNFLFEVPPGSGLNSSGAFSAALATALNRLTGKLIPEEVANWQNYNATHLITKPELKFDKIFRLAWKIESIFHADSSSGACVFAPFISSLGPIIFYTEKRAGTYKLHSSKSLPCDLQGHYNILDKITYWGNRWEDLFKETQYDWPIDFGLIYSGNFMRTRTIIKSLVNTREYLEDVRKSVYDKLKFQFRNTNLLFKEAVTKKNGFWDIYVKVINVMTMEAFFLFYNLLEKGISEENFLKLLKVIKANQDILKVIDVSSPQLDFICDKVEKEAGKLREQAACKLTGSGKKGDILFVTSFHGLREVIFNIIEKLRKETKENIWLDYASWIDGVGDEGVRIEQDLEKGIYSSFISRGSLQIKHLTKEGVVHTDLYTYEEFDTEKPTMDILLNDIEGNIYLQGEKLTSKDIYSATETINILKILINNLGKSVSNKEFARSSYSSDRGEMQSKIVTPLIKVVKKYLNRKMPLYLSGGVGEFSLKLEPGVDIYLIEKKF